jgi:hypothetical protein
MKEADAALRTGLRKVSAREKARRERYDASQGKIQLPDFRILKLDAG